MQVLCEAFDRNGCGARLFTINATALSDSAERLDARWLQRPPWPLTDVALEVIAEIDRRNRERPSAEHIPLTRTPNGQVSLPAWARMVQRQAKQIAAQQGQVAARSHWDTNPTSASSESTDCSTVWTTTRYGCQSWSSPSTTAWSSAGRGSSSASSARATCRTVTSCRGSRPTIARSWSACCSASCPSTRSTRDSRAGGWLRVPARAAAARSGGAVAWGRAAAGHRARSQHVSRAAPGTSRPAPLSLAALEVLTGLLRAIVLTAFREPEIGPAVYPRMVELMIDAVAAHLMPAALLEPAHAN